MATDTCKEVGAIFIHALLFKIYERTYPMGTITIRKPADTSDALQDKCFTEYNEQEKPTVNL